MPHGLWRSSTSTAHCLLLTKVITVKAWWLYFQCFTFSLVLIKHCAVVKESQQYFSQANTWCKHIMPRCDLLTAHHLQAHVPVLSVCRLEHMKALNYLSSLWDYGDWTCSTENRFNFSPQPMTLCSPSEWGAYRTFGCVCDLVSFVRVADTTQS